MQLFRRSPLLRKSKGHLGIGSGFGGFSGFEAFRLSGFRVWSVLRIVFVGVLGFGVSGLSILGSYGLGV